MILFILKVKAFIIGHLPLFLLYPLGRLVGRLGWFLLSKYRARAIENLTMAFGSEKSPREIKRISKKVFENLGITALEFMRIPWLTRSGLAGYVDFTGFERLTTALADQRGVMLCTAHFGNWELLAASIALSSETMDVVARKIDSPLLERFVAWARTRSGNRLVDKRSSMRRLLTILNFNGIVGILMDQNVARQEAVFVDFFGKAAATNKGPAALALRTGSAIIPCFIIREGRGHRAVFDEPIDFRPTGDKQRDTLECTRLITESLERMIRKYPEQWFWVHRRWKTRPE